MQKERNLTYVLLLFFKTSVNNVRRLFGSLKAWLLGAPEVSANVYCNSRTSVLGRLRDYLRLLMGRTLPRDGSDITFP